MAAADRLREYERLFAETQKYNPAKFSQDFERGYGEATNYNKDLIQDRSSAVQQMQALPNQLRNQYYSSPIRNPLAQEELISNRMSTVGNDLTTLTDLLTARKSRYQDVLQTQLQAYLADQQNAQAAAENAWRLYQDALAQEQAARGSGSGGMSMEDLIKLLGGGGEDDITVFEEGGGGGGGNPPRSRTWGEKFLSRGTDYSTQSPSFKSLIRDYSRGGGIPASIIKTIGGAVGNLWGNRNQKNMSFWDKLYNNK